jgi:PPOX class probable F420-dependent enzyme
MTELHPRAREILESDTLAMLTTLDPDGRPQVTGIWVALEGDEIVSGHLARYRKLRNVQRDPRVVYSLVPGTYTAAGIHEYLVIHGHARVTEGGAPELLQRLAHLYMGPDVVFPAMDDPPPGYVLRTKIERVAGSGPWVS